MAICAIDNAMMKTKAINAVSTEDIIEASNPSSVLRITPFTVDYSTKVPSTTVTEFASLACSRCGSIPRDIRSSHHIIL